MPALIDWTSPGFPVNLIARSGVPFDEFFL
jgi:hypothetical protein